MDDKTKRVIRGWLKLSESGKAVFDREIGRLRNAPTWQEASSREQLKTLVTNESGGRPGEECSCCGR